MILEIRVQPRSSKEEIVKLNESSYKVYTRKPAVEGKANRHLIEMLSKYLKTKKNKIKIIKGLKSRSKTVEWEK